MRSNQSRITAADIKYLSLPKRKGFDIIEVNLVDIYLNSKESMKAKAALEDPDTDWNEGYIYVPLY